MVMAGLGLDRHAESFRPAPQARGSHSVPAPEACRRHPAGLTPSSRSRASWCPRAAREYPWGVLWLSQVKTPDIS